MAQTVKRLSTMQENWVRSLGREDPLEKEMAIHSSTITWKIPWTEEPGRLQSMGYKESDTTERLHVTAGWRCSVKRRWGMAEALQAVLPFGLWNLVLRRIPEI